jgi:hypothetical protein
VFFLDGGGACFDARTCAFTGLGTGGEAVYDWSIFGEDPASEDGIFNFARADNPFLDYSFIYVPSCTGDSHLGDRTRKYSPKLTVEHKGFLNGTAALSYLSENYPDAAQVVVLGKTAGSVAAPVYGGLVADLLPDPQITVFGAQSGHIPDDPDLNAKFLGQLWGAYDNMPDWEVNEGLTARDWGAPPVLGAGRPPRPRDRARPLRLRLRPRSGQPGGVARPGPVQAPRGDRRQREGDRGGRRRLAQLHRARQRPRDPRMAKVLRNGGQRRKLVDWVTQLIAGEPVEDVHCKNCRTG